MTKRARLEARIEAYARENSVGQAWDHTRVPARTKQQMAADIAEIRQYRHLGDPDLLNAFIALARKGRIINSGERRDGVIVWIVPDALRLN
jgi:hypothetical protein